MPDSSYSADGTFDVRMLWFSELTMRD